MQENEEARQYTYGEIANHFSYDKYKKRFTPHSKKRNRYTGKYLTMVYNVSPVYPERFALRLLAMNCRNIQSWRDFKTHNGVTYKTFTEAAKASCSFVSENESHCQARGLLASDATWISTLQEVATMLTGKEMRRFFASLLTNCAVSNPLHLWNLFREQLGDDYHGKNEEVRDRRSLFHLHKLLEYRKRSLAEFGLDGLISEEQIAQMEAYRPPEVYMEPESREYRVIQLYKMEMLLGPSQSNRR